MRDSLDKGRVFRQESPLEDCVANNPDDKTPSFSEWVLVLNRGNRNMKSEISQVRNYLDASMIDNGRVSYSFSVVYITCTFGIVTNSGSVILCSKVLANNSVLY